MDKDRETPIARISADYLKYVFGSRKFASNLGRFIRVHPWLTQVRHEKKPTHFFGGSRRRKPLPAALREFAQAM